MSSHRITKDLTAASATPLVLAILIEDDLHGYAIAQRVVELSDGGLTWSEGMLYPLLHRLERQGHLESRWVAADSGRRRKVYRISPTGREVLAEQRRQWMLVNATLERVWA